MLGWFFLSLLGFLCAWCGVLAGRVFPFSFPAGLFLSVGGGLPADGSFVFFLLTSDEYNSCRRPCFSGSWLSGLRQRIANAPAAMDVVARTFESCTIRFGAAAETVSRA